MAQLDKIILVMLGRPGSEIWLVAGAEPVLRMEGAPPHVLINRKLAAPHLKALIVEVAGDAIPQLDAADGGEFSYSPQGQSAITVIVKAWNGAIEARIRPAAKKAIAKIELTRAAMPAGDLRRAATNPAVEARARAPVEAKRHQSSDGLELDLGSLARAPSASPAEPSEFEIDLAGPAPVSPPAARESMARERVAAVAPVEREREREREKEKEKDEPPPSGVTLELRNDRPVTGEPQIHALFRRLVKDNGSDLHLATGERPMLRCDGDLVRLDEYPRFKGDEVMALLRPIVPDRNFKEFETDHDTDFAYEIPGLARFRANLFMDRKGMGGAFRIIPTEIVTAEKLGLSPAVQSLCYLSKGLVLITGPTGSGKSTTLSALVDLVNRTRHDHVVTIEDPIEFVHQNKQCLVNQREVGPHTESFKRALRAALREDPDVIMVGELRDLETIAIAIETAETGHLVFGTLHTSTAYSTIDREIDQFPADRQAQIRVMLAESLKGVVSQTLCKKIGGGRVAAREVLLVNSAVTALIREGKTFQVPSIMQTAKKQGMVLLNDALFELVQAKKVDAKEAYIKAIDKGNFVSALKQAGHKLEFLGGAGT